MKDNEKKTMTYKGYTLVQSDYNNHYMIIDSNDNLCLHAQCTKKLTEEEKKQAIELYLRLKNDKSFFEYSESGGEK